MTPSPIRKVLSSMRRNGVRHLLMGGQACVLYGAAEFSRDIDLVITAENENLARLQAALDDLRAERIAVPPFEKAYLDMGLAVHFRCRNEQVEGLRVDVMTRMRGVEDFELLWSRRTSLEVDGETFELLSLPDLVQAKKTQRDKDWPMIARLVEVNYFQNRHQPSAAQLAFWLRNMRTPLPLLEIAREHAGECAAAVSERPLLLHALAGDEPALRAALKEEEEMERGADRDYWLPLKKTLERLRLQR